MRILGKIFWVCVIIIMCLWTYEFYRVRNGLDPQFYLKVEEHLYEDGKTIEYIGLGYKVFVYERTDMEGREFAFYFAKEKTKEDVGFSSPIVEENTKIEAE